MGLTVQDRNCRKGHARRRARVLARPAPQRTEPITGGAPPRDGPRARPRAEAFRRASTDESVASITLAIMTEHAADVSELISLPEAAERLGLHRATVNDMVLSGRLRGYRLGPHWYLRRSDVDTFHRTYERPKSATRRLAHESSFYWTNELCRWLSYWHDATSGELDAVLDLHLGNIRKYLTLAERNGLVQRDEFGRWTLTTDGLARAARLPEVAEPELPTSATA
jgi:excisionase family DNA binding protein